MGKTGHLVKSEIIEIIQDFPDISIFVETGTYLGNSTKEASFVFDKIITIEINEQLYNKAIDFCDDVIKEKNIIFYLGDTLNLLPNIVNTIKESCESCMWFLDAHQSGIDTSNNGIHVPLLLELDIILSKLYKKVNHIFVIDDVRLFSNAWDWSDISFQSIHSIFKKYDIPIKKQYIKNDRFILITNAKLY